MEKCCHDLLLIFDRDLSVCNSNKNKLLTKYVLYSA